ncbi:TonB-dependent receptor [Epibacterium sp. MM17-32]|uniref:TonB-dependent receptor plug domain-containing protein n=1 Tax=Epibacterium sp. MM17-32 TaxID=2917734 RepID=UPI001EF4FAE7|nr:TonB-dependent receptor [Epibacterium sp. MM17-32]MCG7626719.1 TonB-dependent receptor [Epibacterium sp. MM17-32]
MDKASLSLAAALVVAPAIATAQEGGVIDLGEIIVSGGLTPIEADNYGRSVSVITAQELETRGVTTLQDALRGVPSVAVNSTGSGFTQVRIRGGEGNHVLVLIDGVEANTGSGGEYILSGLTVSDIERIEVLRGPQSALYGANAVSGVISITTKRAEKPGTSYGGGVEFGSNSTRAANAYVRQRFERGELNFSVDTRQTDGEDGSRLDGGDTEFNDRETVNLTGRYEITDQITTGFTLRRTWQHYGSEDTLPFGSTSPTSEGYLVESPANTDRDEVFGSLWLEADSASGRSRHRFSISGTDQENQSRDGAFGPSSSESTHRAFKYLGNFALDGAGLDQSAHRLNLLLEAEEQTYTASFTGSTAFERNSEAVALEYQGELANGLDLQAGLRHDFNDTFENATTWNLSVSYQLPGRDIRVRGAAGRAFVNPTMFEQFGFVPGSFAGNPNLKPEESTSYELGADFGLGDRGELAVTLYRNDVDNLIQGSGMTAVNIPGTSKSRGFELETSFAVLDWLDLSGAYSYTDAETATGAVQVRRPEHELRLSVAAQAYAGRGTVNLDVRHVSGNHGRQFFATGTPTAELPSFTVVDLATTYDLTANAQLTARVTNLLDEDYQESWGYFANGREVFVGVRASF